MEFSHNRPVCFFREWLIELVHGKFSHLWEIEVRGVGCGGGLVPDGLPGNRAPKDPRPEVRRGVDFMGRK
jgi:hypothetical protein